MAQVTLRGNLSESTFPLLSEFSGRGIVIKQYDQNYIPATVSKEDPDKDIGIPSLLYCENVLPVGSGYQSVGFRNQLTNRPSLNPDEFLSYILPIRIADEYIYCCNSNVIDAVGTAFRPIKYTAGVGWGWSDGLSLVPAAPASGFTEITHAVINGELYLCFANYFCYKVVVSGTTITSYAAAPMTGLTVTDILGITSCQGYMIAWTRNAVYWSSLLDPTDFTPSLATGAGGGNVQQVRGDILLCVPHTIGFMIYTTKNIVAVPYSGNSRYPFNFREIPSSAGLVSVAKRSIQQSVTLDPTTGNHYAYTTAGLQTVTMQSSTNAFPEVTDFLAGHVIEDFDPSTNTLTVEETALTTLPTVGLRTVSDRYIVISYGLNSAYYFTHALIYDSSLKRWGKVKITHTCVGELNITNTVDTSGSVLTAAMPEGRNNISFLTAVGDIYAAVLDTNDTSNTTSDGVAIVGKYQLVRSKVTGLEEVEVENVKSHSDFTCHDMYTLDGKNFQVVEGYLKDSAKNVRSYRFHKVGINHSLLFKGAFNLVSFLVTLTTGGSR